MRIKTGNISKSLLYIVLILGAVSASVPFLWMVSTAFKSSDMLFVFPPKFIPENATVANFTQVFEAFPMGRFLGNSVFVAVATTVGQLLLCSMAGYAFAKIDFKGRNLIFIIYLATLMVPKQVTMTPLFILMTKMNWTNTYQALILPEMFSAFGTFFMRQFFRNVPDSIEESAYMDGAKTTQVFFHIVLPLAKPSLATLGIFSFMASWNNFLWPLIITSDTVKMTLPLGLSMLQGRWTTNWNLVMAGTLISILPILLVYIAAQKHIIQGMTHTGLK